MSTVPNYLDDPEYQQISTLAATCAQWNNEQMFGVPIPSTDAARAAACAFGIVHEYQVSIITLLSAGAYSSAFSLLRPCFEALIRGIWIVRAATQAQLQLFYDGKDSRKVEHLLRCIKKGPNGSEDAFLLDTWEASEKSLHRFTHVTYQALIRRLNVEFLKEAMPVSEVIGAVRFATGVALLASVEISCLGNMTGLALHARGLLGVLYPVVS
jgi:hypothetical protein